MNGYQTPEKITRRKAAVDAYIEDNKLTDIHRNILYMATKLKQPHEVSKQHDVDVEELMLDFLLWLRCAKKESIEAHMTNGKSLN